MTVTIVTTTLYGVAIEHWSSLRRTKVCNWLAQQYGPPAQSVWYIDVDYFIETLCLREDIYTMYMLKWSGE